MKKIALVYLNPIDWASIAAPPYGLEILASCISELPVKTTIYNPFLDDDPIHGINQFLQNFNPDLVGISIRNIDNLAHVWESSDRSNDVITSRCFLNDIAPIIQTIKDSSRADIIVGGAGFSIAPVEILKRFDLTYGIKGPGEDAFFQLVKCIVQEKNLEYFVKDNYMSLSGMIYRNDKTILENEIAPDLYLYSGSLNRTKEYSANWTGTTPVRVSYGCIGKCSYCVERNTKAGVLWRNLDDIVDEIVAIGYEGQNIWLTCSEFNMPNSDIPTKLCDKLIEKGINNRYSSYFLPIGFSIDFYNKLIQAGFIDQSICLGITHISDNILNKNQCVFRKNDIKKTIDIFHAAGAKSITIGIILGLPGENQDTINELSEWVIETSEIFGDGFYCYINSGARIYPNTPLESYATISNIDHIFGQTPPYDILEPLVYSNYMSPTELLNVFFEKTKKAKGHISSYNQGNKFMKDDPQVIINMQKAWCYREIQQYEKSNQYFERALDVSKLKENRQKINIEILKNNISKK